MLTALALRLGVLLCAAAASLSAVGSAAAAQLVLPESTLPGFHSAPASSRAAVADLASGLPGGLARLVTQADVQVSALASRTRRLRSDAFVFGSAGAAGRVLAAWRHVHHARSVPVGAAGYESARRGLIAVAWRDGARIGLVALAGPGASDQAVGDAVLADGWLRSPLPTSAWAKVIDQIRPDGSVSKTTALRAFALVYGPLPGVRTPRGQRVTLPSNLLPDAWALRYLSQVTPRVRRVIDARLGLTQMGSHLAHAADYGDSSFKEDSTLDTTANDWASVYADASHLNHALSLKIVAGLSSAAPKWADSSPVDAAGTYSPSGPYCRIRINPAELTNPVPPLGLVLAHEVFHCFQFDLDPNWSALPGWILEGMADWAALSVDPVSWDEGGGNLKTYIGTPETPLFKRVYDSVGFWGHAEDTVPNLFARVATILNAGSNEASFNVAVASTDAFLSSWGSSPFRAIVAGPPWQMQSPIEPPPFALLKPPLTFLTPSTIPGATPVDVEPYTTSQYIVVVDPGAPVLQTTIDGHARLGLTTNYTNLQNAWFCVGGGLCVCPPGTTGHVPPTLPLVNNAALALSGDPGAGTHGELTSYKLSSFCTPEQPTQNSGISNGDPYITTFADHGYGFQAAGEFTLVKSTVDNLEIQSRQVPYKFVLGPRWGDSLAMNTAFAMRDGGSIVEVDKGSPLALYIDRHRRRAHPGQVISLSGGGSVSYGTGQVAVRWADGTTARVLSIGSEGVNIAVNASQSRAGHLRGLLGTDGGAAADDFVGRDGRRYNPRQIERVGLFNFTRAQARVLFGGFGRSWRITQAESLFVYPPGKNTRSYLVPGFPKSLLSLTALSRVRLRAGALACHRSGVTNSSLLVGCEIDFGATGDHRLASATGQVQRATQISGSGGGLSGTWSGRYSGTFSGTFTLTWQQAGSSLRGVIHLHPGGTQPINGTVSGSAIHFGTVGSAAITYSGTVSGNSMAGTYSTPRGGGSWSASMG